LESVRDFQVATDGPVRAVTANGPIDGEIKLPARPLPSSLTGKKGKKNENLTLRRKLIVRENNPIVGHSEQRGLKLLCVFPSKATELGESGLDRNREPTVPGMLVAAVIV